MHEAERAVSTSGHGNAIPYMAMPDFDSEGVRLRYQTAGPETGRPIVLVHGFCSDYQLNWVGSRWQETLVGAGYRVLGLDCRGHGHSDKPHDPAAYRLSTMAGDVTRLLDHLEVQAADYLGYSMGARIGLDAAARHARRLGRVVLGGLGLIGGTGKAELIARRMRGDESVDDPAAETFYRFAASRPINDLEALACCILGQQQDACAPDLGSITVPIAVMAGDQDPIARNAPELASQIPGARYVAIEGRNHMNAVPARQFKAAALEFLSEQT
jgi:pimeloyl-ACP methyl ester carboxylesterase